MTAIQSHRHLAAFAKFMLPRIPISYRPMQGAIALAETATGEASIMPRRRAYFTPGDLMRAARKAKAEGCLTSWEKEGVEFIIRSLDTSGAAGTALDRQSV